jgi:hypothetical protein
MHHKNRQPDERSSYGPRRGRPLSFQIVAD